MKPILVDHYKGIKINGLENQAVRNLDRDKVMIRLMDRLLELNPIQVPNDLVQSTFKMLVMEMEHKMKYESMSFATSPDLDGESLGQMLSDLKDEAFKSVKLNMILEGIIHRESILVSQEDLEREAVLIAEKEQISPQEVKDFFGEDLSLLRKDLLIKKALDLVYDKAVWNSIQ